MNRSEGTQNLIELAKGAMLATTNYHAEMEKLRLAAWRLLPLAERKKKPFNPVADRDQMMITFEDLLGVAVDSVKEHSASFTDS